MSYKEYTNIINKAKELNVNINISTLNKAIKKYEYSYIIENLEKIFLMGE